MRGATLLGEIGGGVTIMPPVEGGWVREDGELIWESPVLVYTFIRPDQFKQRLKALRTFLHTLGRETNQGEVVLEFDSWFYRINEFDED